MAYKIDCIKKYLVFLIIGITIYFGRDTFTYYYFGLLNSYIVLGILLIALSIYVLKEYHQNSLLPNDIGCSLLYLTIMSIAIIVSMILNDAFTLMYFSAIFALLFATVLTYAIPPETFFKSFVVVMSIFVVCSLIGTYILDHIIHIHSFVNSSGLKFNNLVLCGVPAIPRYIRNFGIFREPGVFQFFILLALYYLLILYSKKDKWFYVNTAILVIGLLSTFSISGYACFAVLILAYIISNIDSLRARRKYIYIAVVILCVISIVAYCLVPSIRIMVAAIIYKLNNLGLTDPRIQSIYTNVGLFLKSPLIGNDINYVLTCIPYNTSSLLTMFSVFGLVPGVLYTGMYISHFNLLCRQGRNVLQIALLALFWFLMLSNQCLLTNIFLYAYPMFLYKLKKEKAHTF